MAYRNWNIVLFTLARILTGCYWFCILIWVSTYTANLAAFFTVKNAASPINNLEDILKSSYKVVLIESGSVYEFFKTSQYETHQRIWNRVKAEQTLVKTTKEAIQWLRETEESVFIYDGPIVKYAANQQPCDLMTGNTFLFWLLFGHFVVFWENPEIQHDISYMAVI